MNSRQRRKQRRKKKIITTEIPLSRLKEVAGKIYDHLLFQEVLYNNQPMVTVSHKINLNGLQEVLSEIRIKQIALLK